MLDEDERVCPKGCTMSENEDGDWECDGYDCDCHLDSMVFDEDNDEPEEVEIDRFAEDEPEPIGNDPREREDRDVPWTDVPGNY